MSTTDTTRLIQPTTVAFAGTVYWNYERDASPEDREYHDASARKCCLYCATPATFAQLSSITALVAGLVYQISGSCNQTKWYWLVVPIVAIALTSVSIFGATKASPSRIATNKYGYEWDVNAYSKKCQLIMAIGLGILNLLFAGWGATSIFLSNAKC